MRIRLLSCLLICLSGAACAQEGVATYRNFRHPPLGQYTQTLTGTVNGQPSGPPQKQTSCTAGAPVRGTIAAASQLSAASGCTMRVLADTERLAESEQICQRGDRRQTTRTTMRLVDDRTITVDTATDIAGSLSTTSHSVVTYDGPCSAASRAASEPSAADCAELRASLADSADAGATCAQAPAGMQASCQAQLAAGRRMAEAALARCR